MHALCIWPLENVHIYTSFRTNILPWFLITFVIAHCSFFRGQTEQNITSYTKSDDGNQAMNSVRFAIPRKYKTCQSCPRIYAEVAQLVVFRTIIWPQLLCPEVSAAWRDLFTKYCAGSGSRFWNFPAIRFLFIRVKEVTLGPEEAQERKEKW